MPQILIALMAGNKEGPWLHTVPFRNPQLKVRGLIDGRVTVHLLNDEERPVMCGFEGNGIYPLDTAKKMRVSYADGSSPGLMCHIIER